MFGKKSANGYHELLKGVKIKTLNYGDDTIMTEFVMEKGALLPEHTHPNEQTGYMVKGRMKLYINGIPEVVSEGDSWNIPKDLKHYAEVYEDTIAVEVFHPLRKEYLKYSNEDDIISPAS